MQAVEKSLNDLIEAVKKCETYQEYIKCEQVLDSLPDLKSRVNKYRCDSSRLRNNEHDPELSKYADEIDAEGRLLYKIPEAGAYLSAELALCRLVQHTCEKLVGALEFELPTER